MNEGVAALIAAAVGLIGAIGGAAIGGRAATRGARIGAETTARATAQQVQDQAAVDREHWLRDQRLEAYRAVLVAYDAFIDAVGATERAITRTVFGDTDEQPDWPALGPTGDSVVRAYVHVRLVGPDEARDAAEQLQARVRELHDRLQALAFVVRRMQGNVLATDQATEESLQEVDRLVAEVESLKDPVGSAHSEFVSVVNRIVAGATVR